MNWKKSHRVVAIAITLPLILIALTGIVLQLRNQFEWIQPETISQKIDPLQPYISFEAATKGVPLENVEQIILRPAKGNLSVRLKDGLEIQMHPQTGAILKKSMRRTNFLIELHQGSWLGNIGQYGIHFITGVLLCFLIFSGIMIYPFSRIRR
jgi:uncharacterized iron-regulated membrane protein